MYWNILFNVVLLFIPDNPSYFTVPGGSKFSLLKRRGMGGAPLSSSGSMSPPTTPPGTTSTSASTVVTRRGNRTLLRSVSAQGDASLLVLGSPRICDLAPSQRPQSRRRASSSASDVVISTSPLSLDDDGEVFLSANGEARYYNLGNNPATLPPTAGSGRRRHSIGAFLRSTTATTPSRESHPLVKPEEPKPAHSIRKRCERCAEKGKNSCFYTCMYKLMCVLKLHRCLPLFVEICLVYTSTDK